MKSISIKLSILSLVFLLLPVFSLAENPFPSFPMAFWGNATLNDESLFAGTIIRAYCDDNLIGEITMAENGIYGYTEAAKNKLLISSCGSDILFKYLFPGTEQEQTGGVEIKYIEGFISGTTINKDLNFITTQACDISNGTGIQTWDDNHWADCIVESCNNGYHQENNSCVADSSDGAGGGSSGGGGSYIPSTAPTTSSSTTQGDINGDNKVDKYDFALMMAAWGKTGTNSSDLNGDNKIDKYDFALLMLNWSTI